jgi:hypothetical protein
VINHEVAYVARKYATGDLEQHSITRCEESRGSVTDMRTVVRCLERGAAYDLAAAVMRVLP